MDFRVDFCGIRHRAADLLSQKRGVPLSQPVDKCLDPADGDLKPIRHLVVRGRSYAVVRIQESFQRFECRCFFRGGILLAELFQRFSQDRHRPPGIEDFLCCQKIDRLEPIAFFGLFCIQLYKFLVSSSFRRRARSPTSERWFWKEASKNDRNLPLSRSMPVNARCSTTCRKKPCVRSWASSGEYPRRRAKM